MSVTETDVVDAISVRRATQEVVLTITDHLDWSDEGLHLETLQDKINAYISFIESGELLSKYPNAKGRQVRIDIVAKYEPSDTCKLFIQRVQAVLDGIGVQLTVRVFEGSD